MQISFKQYKVITFAVGVIVFVSLIYFYLSFSNQPKADVITNSSLIPHGYITTNTYLRWLNTDEFRSSVPPTTSPTIPSTSTTTSSITSTTTTTIPVVVTSDLVLTQLTANPTIVKRGRNEVFAFTIKNDGKQKESNIQVNIYDKAGKRFNSKTAVITSLDAGATTTVSITQKISQFSSRGQNIVTGKIEPVQNETNTANNSKETTFTIK